MSPRCYMGLLLLLLLGSLAGQRWLANGGAQLPPESGETASLASALTRATKFRERLMPDAMVVDWNASAAVSPQSKESLSSHVWTVCCTTQDGGEAHFLIEPANGKLIQFSRTSSAPTNNNRRVATDGAAIAAARRFFCNLCPDENGYAWRIHRVLPPRMGVWHVYLSRDSRIAHIAIFASTGNLMWFRKTTTAVAYEELGADDSQTSIGRGYKGS